MRGSSHFTWFSPSSQVSRIVAVGDLDPEVVVTPGIFVDRIVHVAQETQ